MGFNQMYNDIAKPHLVADATKDGRRTVLLTGGSGVVGQALLKRLGEFEVICLVHRSPIDDASVISVRGDVTLPNLGLDDEVYAALAARVDDVIHCAAITDFNRTDGTLEATNIGGTEVVLAFAAAADATVYHVSTAFVNTATDGTTRGQTAIGYASSKSAGEDIVRASGVRHVILRPSVVIGDSGTGEIAAFQGLHQVAAGVFNGWVPMIPFDSSWPIDFVPCDIVADSIATVVEHSITEGEYWITAGNGALTLNDSMNVCLELARDLGVRVDAPRFVPPELFDRLIGPVFIDALPARVKATVLKMLEFFTTYLHSGITMPSSMEELVGLGAQPLPDQRESLRTSLHYFAEVKGYIPAAAALEVA
jgi:nucleoside-diphosphate-sugar epimerase